MEGEQMKELSTNEAYKAMVLVFRPLLEVGGQELG
jgi:hypothetical protein